MKKTSFKRSSMLFAVAMLMTLIFVSAFQLSAFAAAGYVFQEDFSNTSNNGFVWGSAQSVYLYYDVSVNGWYGSGPSSPSPDNKVYRYTDGSMNAGNGKNAIHAFTNGTGGDLTYTATIQRATARQGNFYIYNGYNLSTGTAGTLIARLTIPADTTSFAKYYTGPSTSANLDITAPLATDLPIKIVLKWSAGKYASAEYWINGVKAAATGLASATQTNADYLAVGGAASGINPKFDNIAVYAAAGVTLPSATASITGTARQGQLLSLNYSYTGTCTDYSTYQWQVSDSVGGTYTNISGATSSTFLLTASQLTKYVRCQITVKDVAGNTGSTVITAATAQIDVAASAPPSASTVTISGTPRTGVELTGSYTYGGDYPELNSVLQWQVCDTAGGSYTDIAGANSSTFTPTTAQTGKYLKFKVTPKDNQGTIGAIAYSDAFAQVTGTLLTPAAPTVTGKTFTYVKSPGASSFTTILTKTGVGVIETTTGLTGTSKDYTTTIDSTGPGTYTVTVQAIGDGSTFISSDVSASSTQKTWFSVTYNANGGTGSVPVDTSLYASVNSYTVKGNIGDPILTKTGYTFNNWNTKADGTGTTRLVGAVVTGISSNAIIYAMWTPINYTITFNSQGGSDVIAKTGDYNTKITAPTAPTKDYHSFVGWYKDSNLTTPWVFATDVVTNDTTLYAKWSISLTGGLIISDPVVLSSTITISIENVTQSDIGSVVVVGNFGTSTMNDVFTKSIIIKPGVNTYTIDISQFSQYVGSTTNLFILDNLVNLKPYCWNTGV